MARRRLPPLKALPAFEEAARHLSFSAAAQELNVTHGAISRQMKTLEQHFGVRLFRRLSRRLELTREGEALLPSVRTALDVLEESSRRLGDASRSGPLVVDCLPTFTMRWLIPRLYDFRTRHPQIEVRLVASSAPFSLARGGVDLAIRLGKPPWPDDVEARGFIDDEIGPVCNPAILGRRKLRPADNLRNLPLLHTETRADAWHDWLARTKTTGFDPDKGQRFEHFYFLLEAAVGGLGVAIAPRPLVEEDLRLGRLVAPLGFVHSGRRYHLLYQRDRAEVSKIKVFRTWLVQMVGEPKSISSA